MSVASQVSLGQDEDHNRRDRVSRSSEKLPAAGRSVLHTTAAGRGVCVVRLTFRQSIAASLQGRMSPLMIVVLF